MLRHMRIGLFHGYELSGSGSNEYTRYLAKALDTAGHEVHVLCREPHPEALAGVRRAVRWGGDGASEVLFDREGPGYAVHVLPHGEVRPVFVTDKQREGRVQAFVDLSEEDLAAYTALTTAAVTAVLRATPLDVLHANHVILQPTIAAAACAAVGVPFIIYPHGSAIEYAVRRQERYRRLAGEAIAASAGLIIGSREVQRRLFELYPDLRQRIEERTEIVGVGVDTALFNPLPRAERAASIAALVAAAPSGGRPPALRVELARRLAAKDFDVFTDQRSAYRREHPDADAAGHLAKIPFTTGKIMLFVGALTVGKGLQSLLAAMPAILAKEPDTHLVIVGSGAFREVLEGFTDALASGNGALVDELVRRGNDLEDTHLEGPWLDVAAYLADPALRAVALGAGPKLAAHVHFLGRLGHEYLHHLFPCADVAVFPSVVPEAYPLVLMESLANGVVPAASDFSGFAEGLDHLIPHLGEARVQSMRLPLADDVRVGGIAAKLSTLLADVATNDLTSQLRQIAATEYDWSVRAAAMVKAYARLIAPT